MQIYHRQSPNLIPSIKSNPVAVIVCAICDDTLFRLLCCYLLFDMIWAPWRDSKQTEIKQKTVERQQYYNWLGRDARWLWSGVSGPGYSSVSWLSCWSLPSSSWALLRLHWRGEKAGAASCRATGTAGRHSRWAGPAWQHSSVLSLGCSAPTWTCWQLQSTAGADSHKLCCPAPAKYRQTVRCWL